MSDQNPETPLAEAQPVALPPALGGDPAENILTLEKVLSSARLVERTARICLRADLEADLIDALDQLAGLVDENGVVLEAEDASLGESNAADAEALKIKAHQVRSQMAVETFSVRFRSLNADAWESFEKANRGADGKPKNLREYNNKLIAATAVAPTLTEVEVQSMCASLSARQMNELANTAYEACTQGGLDVPKLPTYSLVQKPDQQ